MGKYIYLLCFEGLLVLFGLWVDAEWMKENAAVIAAVLLGVMILTFIWERRSKLSFISDWLRRNVYWRLGASPPVLKNYDRSVASIAQAAHSPVYQKPDFEDSLVSVEFPYAYPKAVLKAEISRPQGTKHADAGGEPHSLLLIMTVTADHTTVINPCSVVLHGFSDGDDWFLVDEDMRVSNAAISPKTPRHFPIVRRDISDPVTPEPFLLLLKDREVALMENTNYTLVIELVCAYPIPTVVTVSLKTGSNLDAEAKITSIALAETTDVE